MSLEEKTFPAHATHPTLGDAEVAGTLCAAEFALKFAADNDALEVPYDGLVIAFGTKQDPRITFTHEQVADGPRALMSHPPRSERIERLAARWNSAAKKTDYELPAPLPPPATTGNALTDRLDRLFNQ